MTTPMPESATRTPETTRAPDAADQVIPDEQVMDVSNPTFGTHSASAQASGLSGVGYEALDSDGVDLSTLRQP